jgi:hypothetical protein
VSLADWLPGLGLLVIVEHGDGYMSCTATTTRCANRQALGPPGDVIGTVGTVAGGATRVVFRDPSRQGAAEPASLVPEAARTALRGRVGRRSLPNQRVGGAIERRSFATLAQHEAVRHRPS